MLSKQVMELESENKKLRELLKKLNEDIPKPKNCEHCKHYIQHYRRSEYGNYYMLYMGHCICGVPTKKRKGKKHPAPEDTCLCFEERK